MTIIMLLLTKKLNKEKFLFYANIYSNVKTLINILLACAIMFFLSGKANYPRTIIKLLALICFVIISAFDSYLIFRRIKKLRHLDISNREYLLTYIKNTLIMSGLFLLFVQSKYIIKDTEDFVFISICMISIWIYQYIMPYVLRATNKIETTELVAVKDRLLDNCPIKGKYKLYSYEGKKSKSANAVVVGLSFNRHIFISDYFVENASQEEVLGILYHECWHIKNYDLEKRLFFGSVVMLCFFSLTCVMDYLKMGFLEGAILLLVFGCSVFIMYRRMQHRQELKADKFAVSILGEKDVYEKALKRLYDMNDMMKKNSRFFTMISTHPQIKERIKNLDNI